MMDRLRYQPREDDEIGYEVRDKIAGKKMDPSDETAYTHPLVGVITSLVQRQGRTTKPRRQIGSVAVVGRQT
jgi:hypothetical protein